ncbi:MAG TPA: Tad domain-containing protein [Anaerolineaceae bacterium]|nr:Tad domain-containing protein [Anaerolineaceae bacterium]
MKQQKGQIIVIFAVALVVLLGFTALAIDGGMVYSDRRFSQSAADAASLAGGGAGATTLEDEGITYGNFTCTKAGVVSAREDAVDAALARAATNNILGLDDDVTDLHGVTTECVNDKSHFDKHIDIITDVTSETATSFAHLFNGNPLVSQVEGVVRIRPRTEFAYGYAIVSTNKTACHTNDGGVDFTGGGDVHIVGGGIFSNTCLEKSNASGSIVVEGGDIGYYDGGPKKPEKFDPAPQDYDAQMPDFQVPVPVCPGGEHLTQKGGGEIGPGNYDSITMQNGALTMLPGLYCMYGAFKITGGDLTASGVTIYIVEETGNKTFELGGNGAINISAPSDGNEVNGAIPNVLIYLKDGEDGTVKLTGNSDSFFLGMIYAPDGDIEVSGTNGTHPTFHTQLIGEYVDVGGTATIDINYTSARNLEDRPKLDMLK